MKKKLKKICAVAIALALVFAALPLAAETSTPQADTTESTKNSKKAKKEKKKKIKKRKFKAEEYNKALQTNDYNTAMGMLLSLKKMDIAQQIDLSLLQHYTGDYENAIASMEKASESMGIIFAAYLNKKGSQKASGGTILSELATPYRGNIYEYLLIDAFNALNYYKAGQLENAVSCTRRIGEKQQEYAGKYKYLLEDEEENRELRDADGNKIEKPDTSAFLPPKPTEKNIYKTSAFADYLQIVLGAQNNNEIDEYIVRELNLLAPDVDTTSADVPFSKGRIEVLALTGKIAQKVEHVEVVPSPFTLLFGEAGNFKFVWPGYKENSTKAPHVKNVTLSNGEKTKAVLLEDFDKAVENNIILNARKAANRSVARMTVTKTIAAGSAIAGIKAAKDNAFIVLAIETTAIATLLGIDAKEVSDLRQSLALPSKAYCTGFTVEPGTYSVTVEYSNGKKETIENIVVKAGKPVLVESVCN